MDNIKIILELKIIIDILKLNKNKNEIAYTYTDNNNGIIESKIVIDNLIIDLLFDFYQIHNYIDIKITMDKKIIIDKSYQNFNNIINLIIAL